MQTNVDKPKGLSLGLGFRFFENFFLNIFIWNCIQAKQVDP